MEKDALRPFFQRYFSYNWLLGIVLILALGIPRFLIVLNANVSGDYGNVSIIFMLMWILPFILLSKEGQKYTGFKKATNYRWLLLSLLIGTIVCTLMFLLAKLLFDNSIDNPFIYIAKSYTLPEGELTGSNKLMVFFLFAISGMLFSPIGEEFLYRGLVHGCFVGKLGEQKASFIDSIAFALTHLAHFGIIYNLGRWEFLFLPALFWVFGMFVLSLVLFKCKQMSGSIWGAVLGHAGYNLSMIYWIFYHIL